MGPNTDHVRASVQRWLGEMGCLGDSHGVLVVSTDDEEAVGNVFSRLQVGKDVRVSKAPPQGQAVNGSAERSVRAIKENFVCVSEELRIQGLAICDTETAVGAVLEYVCFMLNSHASIHGSSKTPHEFLSGKNPSVSTRPITSMFGSVVLCELPQSAQADDRPRFLEGAYLRPEFNSKSGLCLVMLDGVLRKIHPKSIKLVLPLRGKKHRLCEACWNELNACVHASALGMRPHVHFHASCPCASGSPIRYLRQDAGSEDIRFAELEPLLKRLPSYRKKADTFSLEWPVNNVLWSYAGVKDLLNELGLKQEAVVRLCKLGYASRSGKPVGKRLRFVCDSEEFVKPLRRFQTCRCKEHAQLNDVNWNETGKYNKSLALALCNAAYACARARGVH